MSPVHILIQLLALSATVLAEVTSDEASLIAWKAYGQLISQYITANQPITPGTDFIYVTPPTSNFIRGGTPCPESVTNFELYNAVDHLQNATIPLLGNDGPSYVQSLETYLKSVAILERKLTPDEQAHVDELLAAVTAASDKFTTESNNDFVKWMSDPVAQFYKQSFQTWVSANAPNYNNYKTLLSTADASYNNYMLQLYGAKYNTISEQRKNINDKAKFELAPFPGFNMIVYPGAANYKVNMTPFVNHEITDQVAYRPAYTLAGYEDICDSFFTKSTGTTQLTYGFTSVNGHDWSNLGYQSTVKTSRGGFFGILGYKKTSTSEVTHFNSWSNTWTESVRLTITMKGGPTLVPINTGFWDVGNVRQTYPTLRAKETDDLVGLVRLTHALVGYQIGMTITFTNTDLWRNVTQFINEGKQNGGGGINIFGFSFGSGGSGAYRYSTNDLNTTSNTNGGTITIPPTPEGMVFMLGARGKAL